MKGRTRNYSPSFQGPPAPPALDGSEEVNADQNYCNPSKTFPFGPCVPSRSLERHLQTQLPPWEQACELSQIFITRSWSITRGVTGPQIEQETLPIIYDKRAPDPTIDYKSVHGLGVLYYILAIGTLLHPQKQLYSPEADHFSRLGLVALSSRSVFERPTILTVQCLLLAFIYAYIRGDEVWKNDMTMEAAWSYLSVATQVAQVVRILM
jgi:hypothetical protein